MKPILSSMILVAFLSLALLSLIDSSESRPSNDDVSNMIEALKVLEQYDRLSRPRFGRSVNNPAAFQTNPEEIVNAGNPEKK